MTNNKRDPLEGSPELPLSLNQRRQWIRYLQDKINPSFNISFTYLFKSGVDIELLRKSIQTLFEWHPLFYSKFKSRQGIPFMQIEPASPQIIEEEFNGSFLSHERKKILASLGNRSRQPINIEEGPLYKIFLIRDQNSCTYLHVIVHHIIFDGWSKKIFIEEIGKIYQSYKQKNKLSEHYIEDIFLDSKDESWANKREELSNFWKTYLEGCPLELKFPYDRIRLNDSKGIGQRTSFLIPEKNINILKRIAETENVTLFSIILSFTGLLFQQYSGQDDLTIGVHLANRLSDPGRQKSFGLFSSVSAVRIIKKKNFSFRDLLHHTARSLMDSINHSDLPIEKVLEIVNPVRIPHLNPLFQVSVSWLTGMNIPMYLGDVAGKRISLPAGVSPFDITFYMWEEGKEVKGDIEYNIELLSKSSILLLKNNFLELINLLSAYPDYKLAEVSVLSELDKRIIKKTNSTNVEITSELIHEQFQKQVIDDPLAIALIFENEEISRRELDQRANQLAWQLLAMGMTRGKTIGICLSRSPDMVIAVLAVLKSGCCYLPLDPSFPEQRIKFLVEDSKVELIISQHTIKSRLDNISSFKMLIIEEYKDLFVKFPLSKPDIQTSNEDPVYVMYTSGSTGNPKGVKIRHQSVVNLVNSMSNAPGISKADRILSVVSLSFDMSVYELFMSLCNGATLVLAPGYLLTDARAIIKLIENRDITILQASPTFWNMILGAGWKGKKDLLALTGGEPLGNKLARQLISRVRQLWNCYGPTETTVFSTCFRIENADAPILIGKPIDNTSIYIIDEMNRQLPVNVYGEIMISGMGVAHGYFNRKDLTEEKFMRLDNSEYAYKTGDLGRMLPNGNIEMTGRIDYQIKLRGYRIEPGEIESVLNELKGVRQSVVTLHNFEYNDSRIVAFLDVFPDFNRTSEEINRTISHSLPQYMMPAFYIRTNGFKLTPNGKIDRKNLDFNFDNAISSESTVSSKLTDTEKIIFDIWSEFLKTNDFNITDNFFDVGGNSLLAVAVSDKMEKILKTEIGLRTFFESPRIKDLAETIDNLEMKLEDKNSKDYDLNMDSEIIEGSI